jgi:hypothetical protein
MLFWLWTWVVGLLAGCVLLGGLLAGWLPIVWFATYVACWLAVSYKLYPHRQGVIRLLT